MHYLVSLYTWTLDIAELAIAVCFVVLAPLSLFRRTRGISALGYLVASYLFGVNLFIFGIIVTLSEWGVVALVIGLFLAGVGVVPVALLASIFHDGTPSGNFALDCC